MSDLPKRMAEVTIRRPCGCEAVVRIYAPTKKRIADLARAMRQGLCEVHSVDLQRLFGKNVVR